MTPRDGYTPSGWNVCMHETDPEMRRGDGTPVIGFGAVRDREGEELRRAIAIARAHMESAGDATRVATLKNLGVRWCGLQPARG